MSLDNAILVDLDGTLTNVEHRVHHVQDRANPDWKSFNEKMVHDTLNDWCHCLIESMQSNGDKVIFITGRRENYRQHTETWLEKHNISYQALYMRGIEDRRDDHEIKKEIFRRNIEGKFQVRFVVEDRASVVKMWREIGLVCLQCDWGDF